MCEPKKTCTRCGEEKPLSVFAKDPRRSDGRQGFCKVCANAHSKVWREGHREHAKQWQYKRYRRQLLQSLLWGAKARQLERGEPWDLELEDFPVRDRCPVCHRAFTPPDPKNPRHSRSIDRIDNTKGYEKGNVDWICRRCNTLKNDGTVEEHRQIVAYMESHLHPAVGYQSVPGFPFCF